MDRADASPSVLQNPSSYIYDGLRRRRRRMLEVPSPKPVMLVFKNQRAPQNHLGAPGPSHYLARPPLRLPLVEPLKS
jgi:hypothetical protein